MGQYCTLLDFVCKLYIMSGEESDYGRSDNGSVTDTFTWEEDDSGSEGALGQKVAAEQGGEKG
eukprot:10001788-Ditylum_brightwellii.AAC.1